MKTRNLFLAGGAFVVAVGSAYASLFVPANIFVKAKMSSLPSAPIVCLDTQQTCDETGTNNVCTVIVPLQSGATATAASSSSINTYRSGCAVTLFSSAAEIKNSQITNRPYQLVEE